MVFQNVWIWILLFSFTNSCCEELIFRFGIVSPLSGTISPLIMFSISAILFGMPHFAGMPSGIVGVLLASVLGFFLAKSVYETKGLFWAISIHFLQDIVIFSSLFLIHLKK